MKRRDFVVAGAATFILPAVAGAQKKTPVIGLLWNDSVKPSLASLVRDIRFDPKRLFDEKGRRKKLHEMDEDTLLAVRVEEDKDGYLKIKSPDKAAAREQLMKHLGMFERDNTQKPSVGVNVVHVEGFRSVEFDPIPLTRKG